jgi:signal transduction histidine kinase
LTNLGIVENSDLEFYGLFGKTIFMVFVAIMIVRFKAFNVGLLASKALLIALIILTASQFTYIDNTTGIVLTALTLVITGVIGIALLRSVKNEIRQRSQLEILTKQLEKTNVRLKELDKLKSEFVSIASHQLRSPLTAIRGYASLVLEGSYGKIPEKAKEVIERIEESSKLMALGIEDYLNVSRIESGNMKYIMSDFNLRNETENLCDDLRIDAIKQGLVLIFRTNLKSKGIVNADIGKTAQVIQNLIHNAIKYTKKGSIKVLVRDDVVNKKLHIDIEDTGIGMSEKTIDKLFQKFERADNANSANISGTGLGLYVAVKMTEAMGGSISAHSEGDGKGSRFTITLPLAM